MIEQEPTFTTIVLELPEALLEEAVRLGIDLDSAADAGLRAAIDDAHAKSRNADRQ